MTFSTVKYRISLIVVLLVLFSVPSASTMAQGVSYINSPLHRDLENIANKIDQSNVATANAIKSAALTTAIMSGLKTLGDTLQNEKFRDASERIFKSEREWKIYQASTSLGALTVVHGNGKFAVLINGSSGQMAGDYDETASGIVEKGRLLIDTNKKLFKTNPIFGSGENVTLRLIDSSDYQR